jgi:hypothetical protein
MQEETLGKVDFNNLVAGLAASAIAVLSQVEILIDPAAAEAETEELSEEEIRKRASHGLTGARQLIDTLAVLPADPLREPGEPASARGRCG